MWVRWHPHPGLLTAIVFVLCIAQIGPILVLIPACIWMFSHASGMAATIFLIYSIPMALLDNFCVRFSSAAEWSCR